jgi:hypothetical protein
VPPLALAAAGDPLCLMTAVDAVLVAPIAAPAQVEYSPAGVLDELNLP